jgi:hypothetical protein
MSSSGTKFMSKFLKIRQLVQTLKRGTHGRAELHTRQGEHITIFSFIKNEK